jgi:pimeloyl-ACP methyl ester carboxylesterase
VTTRGLVSETPRTVESYAKTPNGRIFVNHTPGVDPPIVLLHGFPDDHRIYDRLLPRLAPRRAVSFDFVGYGRSDRSPGARTSPTDHGAEITALLDDLEADRAILVCHDASGPDAVHYAVSHPDRVAHLVLLNTVVGNQPSLRMPEMTRLFAEPQLKTLADDLVGDPSQLLWLLQRWGVQWGLDSDDPEGIVRNSILPQFFGDEGQPDAIRAIRAWTAGLFDALDQGDRLIEGGTLARLAVPVSIIWGEADPYLSSSLAAEIAALFHDPSMHLVAGVGHYPQHDRPEEVAELLRQCEPS